MNFAYVHLACLVLSAAAPSDGLYLDQRDVIVAPQQSPDLAFTVGDLPAAARPVLWIAPRMVFMLERGAGPCLGIEINGHELTLERLLFAEKTYQTPCYNLWPLPQLDKCRKATREPFEGRHRWVVRSDDNFVVGQVDLTSKWRGAAVEGLEPSYAIDLSGLLITGENRLSLRFLSRPKLASYDTGLAATVEWPIPVFSIHAAFVKVGAIEAEQVKAYNAEHTRSIDPAPRTFDVQSAAGFEAMQRHYTQAAEQAQSPKLGGFLRFVHANYLLWRGQTPQAQLLLARSALDAPDAHFADQTLFLLGVAQSRQDMVEAADKTWAQLKQKFPTSKWVQLAEREAAIVSWQGEPQPINWPYLEVAPASGPVELDGRLDDAAWRDAPATDAFCVYQAVYRKPPVRTVARALYDDRYLYLAVKCDEPRMDLVGSRAEPKRDASVWSGDCIELFLDPGRTYTQSLEIDLGIEGVIADFRNVWVVSYTGYDPDRVDRIHKADDHWSVEMALPWESLGVSKPNAGDVWLGNVIRIRPGGQTDKFIAYVLGLSDWRFADHEKLAWLIFR